MNGLLKTEFNATSIELNPLVSIPDWNLSQSLYDESILTDCSIDPLVPGNRLVHRRDGSIELTPKSPVFSSVATPSKDLFFSFRRKKTAAHIVISFY